MNAPNEFKKDKRLVLVSYVKATAFCLLFGTAAVYVTEYVNHHLFISHDWLQVLLGDSPWCDRHMGDPDFEWKHSPLNPEPAIAQSLDGYRIHCYDFHSRADRRLRL